MNFEKIITASKNNDKKVILVGYSPTGGGHTQRTFDILEEALRQSKICDNDVVIFHMPPVWENKVNTAINVITNTLIGRGIIVAYCLADRSVYGYLTSTGGSDDSKIINCFAQYPLRNTSKNLGYGNVILWTDIVKETQGSCQIYYGKKSNNKVVTVISSDYKKLISIPTPIDALYSQKYPLILPISPKKLFEYLINTLSLNKNKIFVLTDMDPWLQAAANSVYIPRENCIDQQNHAILLEDASGKLLTNDENYLNPRNALLAKVLSCNSNMISHMKLGEKNTVSKIIKDAKDLGISENTKVVEARNKISEFLLNGNFSYEKVKEPYTGGCVISFCKSPYQVKGLIYIYAHNFNKLIINTIIKKINVAPYNDKLFLVCGSNITNYNAMSLAYLYGGHGILTAGAGTTGEWIYLHNKVWSQSKIFLLPINGHNEQMKNSEYVISNYKNDARSCKNSELNLEKELNEFLKICTDSYASMTMSNLLTAAKSTDTYAKQAVDIWFQKDNSNKFASYVDTETAMYKNSILKINRRFLKFAFQSLNYLESYYNSTEKGNFYMTIQLTSKERIIFNDKNKFSNDATKINRIFEYINIQQGPIKIEKENLLLFNSYKDTLQEILNEKTTNEAKLNLIHPLKLEFGEELTTGF